MPHRILLTTFGSYGDINPFVGLALGLQARGHHAVIATSPYYRDYIEREGIEFIGVRPDIDPGDRALIARIMNRRRGSEYLVREVLMDSLPESYGDISHAATGAHAIVTHVIPFAGPVVAQEFGIPWISSLLAPVSFFSAHDLPVFPPAPWLKPVTDIPGVGRLVVPVLRAATQSWMRPLHDLRAERGLPKGEHPLFDGAHSPERVLALFSPLLATAQLDWPANVTVTGPILYNAGGQERLNPDIERFLDAGAPPVVFTLGSSAVGAAGSFYAESARAAEQAGVRAILLIGPHDENRPSWLLPGTILVVASAPHSMLFPRAAAVVHQGGIGTLHQAMRSGKPMIVVPHAHDQPDNAYRARRLGVARVIYPERYRAGRVAHELNLLLTDDTLRARASAVGAVLRAEDGVGNACDAIEMVLARAYGTGR